MEITGASNLVTGIATANYDSVPLVCFTGQVPTYLIGNNAFQEIDIVRIVKSIGKYAVTVRRREDMAAAIREAFAAAKSGRPGVAVVDLPKDIQQALGSDVYPENPSIARDAIAAFLLQQPTYDFAEWKAQIQRWKEEKPLEMTQCNKAEVTPLAVIHKINQIFTNAVITTDVGQNQLWTTQFLELTKHKQMLTSGGFGTMGYGCRTDFADIQNKNECGGNKQWQNHYLRNWAADTSGKGIT